MRTLIQTAFAAALATSGALNSLGPSDDNVTVRIQFSRAQPVSQVYQKIRQKAHNACRVKSPIGLSSNRQFKECVWEVINKSVELMAWPELVEYHDLRERDGAPFVRNP